jgi:hypothetical protein
MGKYECKSLGQHEKCKYLSFVIILPFRVRKELWRVSPPSTIQSFEVVFSVENDWKLDDDDKT